MEALIAVFENCLIIGQSCCDFLMFVARRKDRHQLPTPIQVRLLAQTDWAQRNLGVTGWELENLMSLKRLRSQLRLKKISAQSVDSSLIGKGFS